MKKKGFTLIELLAVIVILAIIALITVPMIMNVIEKAKKGALEDSAYGMIEAANLYYSTNNETDTLEFTCSNSGCINGELKLNYKGSIKNGKVKLYNDGKVSVCIENEKYAALKLANETKVSLKTGVCNYSNEDYVVDEVVSLDIYKELEAKYNIALANQLDTSDANAEATDIMDGKTAYVNGNKIAGEIVNRGLLNWSPSTALTYSIPSGYYTGGTISTVNAYNSGYSAGRNSKNFTKFYATITVGDMVNNYSIDIKPYYSNWANITIDNIMVMLNSYEHYMPSGYSFVPIKQTDVSYSNGIIYVNCVGGIYGSDNGKAYQLFRNYNPSNYQVSNTALVGISY